MENGKFWLKSNTGRFFELNDLKGLKSEDLAKNPLFSKLLNIFDTDKSGNLESNNSQGLNELSSIFAGLKTAAGEDSVLSDEELGLYLTQKGVSEEVKSSDMQRFVEALSDREVKTEEFLMPDGTIVEKEITIVSGRPVYVVRKENGVILSRTELSYVASSADNYAHVVLDTTNADGSKSSSLVLGVEPNGDVLSQNYISRITEGVDGSVTAVYNNAEMGCLVEIIQKGEEVF